MSDRTYTASSDATPVEMFPGLVRRNLSTTDEMMMCEFTFAPNAVVPEHSHMNQQIGYVVRGTVEMTIAGNVRVCEAGDSYAIPGGTLHSGRALTEAVVIDIFLPPREDYR